MLKFSFIVILILTGLVGLPGQSLYAAVLSPDLQSRLDASDPDEPIAVIVTMADGIDWNAYTDLTPTLRRRLLVAALRSKAAVTLPPLRQFLLANRAANLKELWMINGISASAPASVVRRLENLPGVSRVTLDEVIHLPETMTAQAGPVEWNIDAVRAPLLWGLGFDGSGVLVAGLDSGVDLNHPDLSSRWRGGSNSWFDPNGEHDAPYDKSGHGTGTMGIVLGGDASGAAIGMAPGAQWIAAKIFNDAGTASTSGIHLSFQWLVDPDGNPNTDDAPDVVNNSWGFNTLVDHCLEEFRTDLQILKAAGIAVVFSAGNEGPSPATSISPANNPDSFAVGAVSADASIAGFSSRGPSACASGEEVYPHVVAPGVNVMTAALSYGGVDPTPWKSASGTSFAAPHVSGAMALLLDAFPESSTAEVETALKITARDLGDPGPDDTYGHGMLDVLAAYRALAGCTDQDGDGYFLEPACGTPLDCDDTDPSIFPGGQEVKYDCVDQDCNGYDLTIDISHALYRADLDRLEVHATSQLAEAAALQLEGFGPMTWNEALQRWEKNDMAEADPGWIDVSGPEGTAQAATTSCTNSCQADIDGDLMVDFDDLNLLKGNFFADCTVLPPSEQCVGDLNRDGRVDFADLGILKAEFFRSDCLTCN